MNKNMKKGVVITAIGASALILCAHTFQNYNQNREFTYIVDEDGNIVPTGKIKYDEAQKYCLATTGTQDGKLEIRIVDRIKEAPEIYSYIDVLKGSKIAREFQVEMEDSTYMSKLVADHSCCIWRDIKGDLEYYNMMKQNYTPDDFEELISRMTEDYDFENGCPMRIENNNFKK